MRGLQRRSGAKLDVEVDIAPRPGTARAQLVVADDALVGELLDRVPDQLHLLGGQRLVDQHPRGLGDQPHPGADHDDGDGERDDRVDPPRPGQVDRDEADQDGGGGERVGAEVRGIARERRRAGPPRRPRQPPGDAEVEPERDRHDDDPEPDLVHAAVVDEMADRLEGDRGRADEDQDPLDRRRQVLDLLVPVAVRLVGRLVGLAHRQQGDHRCDEVDARVHRLGEDRHRPGDRAGHHLEQDQGGVGEHRQRGGAGLRATRGGASPGWPRERQGWCAVGHQRDPDSHPTSSAAAAPRWLIASFSSSLSSAIVRPPGSPSGTNAGS